MSTPQSIIAIENVSFSYDGKNNVIENVNLSVRTGDYLGLIGSNGGGKTTLLQLMLHLLEPERGVISIFGEDISRFRQWYRIGYVSQKATEFDSLFPATVEEVVIMGRYARRGFLRGMMDEDHAKTQEALERVGMAEFKNRRISDLSGGQKQRVFLARALASDPEVIVLDEPTTGVDQEAEEQFYELLARLNREQGMTLVLVSHDLERVAREATCVAVVEKHLRYYTDPREAVARERVVHPHH